MLNFQNQNVLWWLLPVLIFIAFLLRKSYKNDKEVLKLLGTEASRFKPLSLFTVMVIIFSSLFAIFANPAEQTTEQVATVSVKNNYIFLGDASVSMRASAEPYRQSQIDIAKNIMNEILDFLPANFQLFGYERVAIDLSPLSENIDYLKTVIEKNFYAGMFRQLQGSDIANAIYTVVNLKKENPVYENLRYVILFSDGDLRVSSMSQSVLITKLSQALEAAKEHDLKIITVGIGSAVGWKIPLYDDSGDFTGEYMPEKSYPFDSPPFVSFLNENNLRVIAEATGGRYFYYKQMDELKIYLMNTLSDGTLATGESQILSTKDMSYIYAWIALGGIFVLLSFKKQLL